MTHYGIRQQIWFVLILFSLWQYVEAYFAEPDTTLGVYDLLRRTWRRNPPCNAEDNLRAGLVVIEAWFRGYWGSPGLVGVQIARLWPLAGILDYEDTQLKTSSRVRMGLSLAWKASLAIWICRFPTIVTDCVTLAFSGVYINQRVLVHRTNNNHTIG